MAFYFLVWFFNSTLILSIILQLFSMIPYLFFYFKLILLWILTLDLSYFRIFKTLFTLFNSFFSFTLFSIHIISLTTLFTITRIFWDSPLIFLPQLVHFMTSTNWHSHSQSLFRFHDCFLQAILLSLLLYHNFTHTRI